MKKVYKTKAEIKSYNNKLKTLELIFFPNENLDEEYPNENINETSHNNWFARHPTNIEMIDAKNNNGKGKGLELLSQSTLKSDEDSQSGEEENSHDPNDKKHSSQNTRSIKYPIFLIIMQCIT